MGGVPEHMRCHTMQYCSRAQLEGWHSLLCCTACRSCALLHGRGDVCLIGAAQSAMGRLRLSVETGRGVPVGSVNGSVFVLLSFENIFVYVLTRSPLWNCRGHMKRPRRPAEGAAAGSRERDPPFSSYCVLYTVVRFVPCSSNVQISPVVVRFTLGWDVRLAFAETSSLAEVVLLSGTGEVSLSDLVEVREGRFAPFSVASRARDEARVLSDEPDGRLEVLEGRPSLAPLSRWLPSALATAASRRTLLNELLAPLVRLLLEWREAGDERSEWREDWSASSELLCLSMAAGDFGVDGASGKACH